MAEKEYDFHRVMEAGTRGHLFMQDREIRQVVVFDRYLCMVRTGEELFAMKNKCPHSGGTIADGFLDANCDIVCPLHRFRFSIRDGKNTSGEGYYLENYPVEIREGKVYVGLPRKRFLGIF